MSNQQINDGGPAFPSEEQIRCNGEVCDIRKFTGMTIRDYFAAAALQGILSNHQECSNFDSGKERAEYCYIVANAMLKARGGQMSDHIPDIGKMVGDTPRTDKQYWYDGDYVPSDFARQLERELNAANEMFRKLNIHTLNLTDRIKRLEKAGDAVEERLGCGCGCGGPCKVCQSASDNWFKAKEAKP